MLLEIRELGRRNMDVFSLSCCLIKEDTEADASGSAGGFHCLIIADTVANARRDEQKQS